MMIKKSTFKMLVTLLCAVVLALGGGYMGARLALNATEARGYDNESIQAYNPDVLMADALAAPPAAPATGTQVLTLPDLFDGANPAVVAISIEVSGRNAFGQTVTRPASGSGFFVSADGYIVTNDHVIEGASHITVLLYDGRQYPATLVGRDPASDIAVIKIDVTGHAYLAFGDSDTVRVGDQVAAIGNPLGELANSMTVGVISALDRDINVEGTTRTKLQTDAAVNRGNSGGPLLNLYGEVVGVVNAKSVGADVEGLGFAIPSNEAMEVVAQLMDYGFVRGRAIMGIMVNEHVQISSVNVGGAAYQANILAGDFILAIDGTTVATFESLRAALDALSPGDEVAVRLNRNGTELTVYVILDEYRPHGL